VDKILGIIAEFNPFHNGHKYLIDQAKSIVNPDCTVIAMSGNFTQRGQASIINKFEKTKTVLNSGANLVVEIPTDYSISSAENFAEGGVKVLMQAHATHIAFGIEDDNLDTIKLIAETLVDESEEFKAILKKYMDEGLSFAQSRCKALIEYLKDEKIEETINQPNNILAIEYLKAIKRLNANFEIVPIKRNKEFVSSTEIRNKIFKGEDYTADIPEESRKILMENNGNLLKLDDFGKIIIYKLRTIDSNMLNNLADVAEGLDNLMVKYAKETNNLEELIQNIKSKRYTQTRIQRILLYVLFEITKEDMKLSKEIMPYVRVLGMDSEGEKLLKDIDQNVLVTSVKKFYDGCSEEYKRLLDLDIKATDVYSLMSSKDYNADLDYTNGLIIKG
jgi:predicted nucleotidyltransferase